jgi:hypothetical protein
MSFLRLSKKMQQQYLKTDHNLIFQTLTYVLNTTHPLHIKLLSEAQK